MLHILLIRVAWDPGEFLRKKMHWGNDRGGGGEGKGKVVGK